MELPQEIHCPPLSASPAAFFEALYEQAFPGFARFAARMSGTFEDARDVFHDALVIFYEKSQEPEFVQPTTPEAYVVGIAKHLWFKKYHKEQHTITLAAPEAALNVPEDLHPTVNERRLLTILERAGEKCLQLLRKFYFERTSLREIADEFQYVDEHSAAVQKHKCIGKIRDVIRLKSMDYEDFLQ